MPEQSVEPNGRRDVPGEVGRQSGSASCDSPSLSPAVPHLYRFEIGILGSTDRRPPLQMFPIRHAATHGLKWSAVKNER